MSSITLLTHYTYKEVPEYEWANPHPEEDIYTGEGNTGYLG